MIELNLKDMEFGYQLVLLISTLLKTCGIFYIVIFEKEHQLVPLKKAELGIAFIVPLRLLIIDGGYNLLTVLMVSNIS